MQFVKFDFVSDSPEIKIDIRWNFAIILYLKVLLPCFHHFWRLCLPDSMQ